MELYLERGGVRLTDGAASMSIEQWDGQPTQVPYQDQAIWQWGNYSLFSKHLLLRHTEVSLKQNLKPV